MHYLSYKHTKLLSFFQIYKTIDFEYCTLKNYFSHNTNN